MSSILSYLGGAIAIAEKIGTTIAEDVAVFQSGTPVEVAPIKVYLGGQHVQLAIVITKLP